MKLIYGISRWTNPNTNKRTHIPNHHGQPLCIKSNNPYRQHTYETTEGDAPTCFRCLKLMKEERICGNACCPHLQINLCADTSEHHHLTCGPKYEAGEGLPNMQELTELCLGNFRECKHWPKDMVLLEGAKGREN